MSDQSLREALEQKLATTDGWTVSNEFLLGLLAAHPAEPAPVITDDVMETAIKAASAAWNDGPRAAIHAALEAAAPLLGPRPVPTREQIDELLQLHRVGSYDRSYDPDFPSALVNYRRKLRNALLALLNGAE